MSQELENFYTTIKYYQAHALFPLKGFDTNSLDSSFNFIDSPYKPTYQING